MVKTSIFGPEPDGRVAAVLNNDSPHMQYARLGREACLAELGRRAIAFEEAPPTDWAGGALGSTAGIERAATKVTQSLKARQGSGTKHAQRAKDETSAKSMSPKSDGNAPAAVLAPVRLRGPLRGVAIHPALPEKLWMKSTSEVFDCRLVLALDDFAEVLREHEVVEVVHRSAFRSERDRDCTPYPSKQQCAALAVDVSTFKKKDGSVLDIEKDFQRHVGSATCAVGGGPNPATPAAAELWDIVCESARRGLFHVTLTMNVNAERDNHLHLEIAPDVGGRMRIK